MTDDKNVYCVVERIGDEKIENSNHVKGVYRLLVQRGSHSRLPCPDRSGRDVVSDVRPVKNAEGKSEGEFWPRGPWNGDRGVKEEVVYP